MVHAVTFIFAFSCMSLDSIRVMISIDTELFLKKLIYYHLYASASKWLNWSLTKITSLARRDGNPNSSKCSPNLGNWSFGHQPSKLCYNFLINMYLLFT